MLKEILEKLIGFETISHQSNLALITYVRDLLETAGAQVDLIMNDTGTKANLYATVGPTDRPGILLSGHTDVVPVTGQNWTVPPFELTTKDARYYGRGTADMKGFVACALDAALAAAKVDLQTPLHLAFSYDEEIGCIGVRSLIDMLAEAPFHPLLCIVGEPTNMAVATGHKGKIAARATCRGVEAHSALAPFGLNAIHLATDFVNVLRSLQQELAKKGTKDSDYDVAYTTVHAGKIAGGVALNIVPNLCTVDFEIRNLRADDPNEIMNHIKDQAAKIVTSADLEASIDIETTFTYPGLDTDINADVVSFVKSLTGANGTIKVAFGTEGGLFDQVLNIPTVICGPGSMAQGHKPDEYVTADQFNQCRAMLSNLVAKLQTGL